MFRQNMLTFFIFLTLSVNIQDFVIFWGLSELGVNKTTLGFGISVTV